MVEVADAIVGGAVWADFDEGEVVATLARLPRRPRDPQMSAPDAQARGDSLNNTCPPQARLASFGVVYGVDGKMLMARDTTRATVTSDTVDWVIIVSLAHSDIGSVSVGLNAVALVNDR